MGNIARPPCDEAVMLAGDCEQTATTNGVWILAATILGSSMAFIDGTVVNVALPALQSALRATLADVQWVVEAYALFLAALLLIGGSLGDRYGRRRIFVAGVVIGMIVSFGYHRAFADPRNYTKRALLTLAVICIVNGHLAVLLYGTFSAALRSENGLFTLTKPNVLRLDLDSLGFEFAAGTFTAKTPQWRPG